MSTTTSSRRGGWVLALGLVLLFAAGTALILASGPQAAGPARASVQQAACTGSSLEPPIGSQLAVEEIGIDGTSSTDSPALRRLYAIAALTIVNKAVAEHAALRIVALGASGVGARVVFEASFAATGDDELFNLAASNRSRCLALRGVAALSSLSGVGRDRGTDVAGTLRALVENARSVAADGARVTVTALTDGCQAPSASGLNRELTDVCGMLAAGKTASAILAAHSGEFTLPDASGLTIVMRGVGVGRRPEAASTRLTQTLVGFWATVCRRAHAKACLIGSDLP